MNIQQDSQQNRIFKLEDGREVTLVKNLSECTEHTLSWDLKDVEEKITLTDQEQMRAKAFGFDLSKVLIVKEKLIEGLSPTEIEKQDICVRSTVYNYKKILEIPPVKNTKKQVKYTKNTKNLSCVFPILLIDSNLFVQTPILHFFVFIALLLGTYTYLSNRYKTFMHERAKHLEVANKLHLQFTKVCNLAFCREPILCNSELDARYYKSLLKFYNNQGRDVFVLEKQLGESPNAFWTRKEIWIAQYTSANRDMIDVGRENLNIFWRDIESKGLLDYLYYPLRENWQESKQFLEQSIQHLIDNPRPYQGDRAKQKYLVDIQPIKQIQMFNH